MTLVSSRAPERPEPARPPADRADRPAISPVLWSELAAAPFDHPWDLAPGITAPVADPGARQLGWTLESMLEEPVRDAFAASSVEAPPQALVLGCGEGRLAHRLIGWGAARVVGVESDVQRLRRAELLRDHFAVAPSALALREAPGSDAIEAVGLGTFAVVVVTVVPDAPGERASVLLGARACARRLCALIVDGPEGETVAAAAREAGFEHLEAVRPPGEGERRYVLGERVLVLARGGEPA